MADRTGTLFAQPDAAVRAGDRLLMSRGQTGMFMVETDPATIATLSGVHHLEFRVSEIPGPLPIAGDLPPYTPPPSLVELFEGAL